MKLEVFLVFSVYLPLLGLLSHSEGTNVWSGKANITAVEGESASLAWKVTLTGSYVNKAWTYVKFLQAEGATTKALVTFQPSGIITINYPSYNSRLSDMTFNVSQSGAVVAIRFTIASLVRSTDMKSYKAMLGFRTDTSTYPGVTKLTILVPPKLMKGTFTMTNKNWTADLYRTSSNAYILLKMDVTEALNLVYGKLLSKVEVVGFVKGSVAVNFKLYIDADIENPIFLLVKAVEKNGGQINGLMISVGSIKAGFTKDEHYVRPAARSSASDHKIGVGIGVGVFFLLLAGMDIY